MLAFNTSEQTQDSINKVAISTPNTAANYWSFTESPKTLTYTRTSTANSSKFTFYTHSADGSVGVKLPPDMTIGNIVSLSSNFTVVNTNPGDTQNTNSVVIFFSIYTKPKNNGTDRASWYNSRIAITPQINTDNNGHRIISGVSYTITPDHFGAAGTVLSTSFSSSDLVNFILMSSNSIEPLINWRFNLVNVFVENNIIPVINSLDKNFGNAGDTLTINGSRLMQMSKVTFNTTDISATQVSDTQVSVIIPNIQGTTINIKTKNTFVSSNALTFTYLPFITSFSKTSSIPGDNVIIYGDHLLGISQVLYNTSTTQFTNTNDTEINTILPYFLPGVVSVKVKSLLGDSNTINFTYNYQTPIIDTLSITNGKIGDKIVITGRHLFNSKVTFNFYNSTGRIFIKPEINTDFSIRVSVPKGVSGITTNVNVLSKGGLSNTLHFTYKYERPIVKNTSIVNNKLILIGNNFLGVSKIQCISSFPKLNMEFILDPDTPSTKIIVNLYILKGNIRLNLINSNASPELQATTNIISVP